MMTINDVYQLPVSEAVIDKTMRNVVKKYNFTYRSLMYQRTPVELLDNLYMGDLAKNALYDYLVNKCSNSVIDYDEVRTDNFESADPGWDMMVGNLKLKVEIKSSIPPNGESHIDIINKRDIKITASHDKGRTWINPNDIESDIHVQIYFYAKSYRNGYDNFETLSNVITNDYRKVRQIINADKYNKPLFFGFSTKKLIIAHINSLPQNNRTWTFSWTSRIYWKCPIKTAYNLPTLIKVINEH